MPGGHIQLVSVTKRFAEVAVDGIDLTITGGEFFSLLRAVRLWQDDDAPADRRT